MAPTNMRSRVARPGHDAKLERAIVLQLLDDERRGQLTIAALAARLGVEARRVEAACARLSLAGVVALEGAAVAPSQAARRLDELELIGV